MVEHSDFAVGNIGIFEASEPWGPWKTISYESGFGTGHVAQKSFYWNISPKWLSSDGKDFVLIFTGIDELDSWNTVEASFTINNIGETSPYPQSNFITGITYNWASHKSLAPGSDGWATTWADDGNLYSIWGNGGGFGGTNVNGRVSLGVARIEGQGSTYTGYNVYGGFNAENPSNIDGKSRGIICIDSVLYMLVGPGSYPDEFNESRLYKSTDHAATWLRNDSWAFLKSEGIIMPGFLQFGKNFTNALDDYIYIYAQRYIDDISQIPGKIDLIRVQINQIMNRASYTFFAGFNESGYPLWASDINLRQPVFEDPNGVGRGLGVNVTFDPGLNRYILIVEHGNFAEGNMGIFESPNPWGLWKTVAYENGFGAGHIQQTSYYWNISPKWISTDGQHFVLTFTGSNELESWNTVEATFTLNPVLIPQFFDQTNISLIDLYRGSINCGDYDNDGYLDILLTGDWNDGGFYQSFSKVYHNNGNNTYSEQTSISLPGLSNSKPTWGDYDNDGYVDILLKVRIFIITIRITHLRKIPQ